MRDLIIRLSILLCSSLLFFYFLRTVSLSVISSIVLWFFFVGTVIYLDFEFLLEEYRKRKPVAETLQYPLQKEGE